MYEEDVYFFCSVFTFAGNPHKLVFCQFWKLIVKKKKKKSPTESHAQQMKTLFLHSASKPEMSYFILQETDDMLQRAHRCRISSQSELMSLAGKGPAPHCEDLLLNVSYFQISVCLF